MRKGNHKTFSDVTPLQIGRRTMAQWEMKRFEISNCHVFTLYICISIEEISHFLKLLGKQELFSIDSKMKNDLMPAKLSILKLRALRSRPSYKFATFRCQVGELNCKACMHDEETVLSRSMLCLKVVGAFTATNAAVMLASPTSAQASEWKPRRHLRSMGYERVSLSEFASSPVPPPKKNEVAQQRSLEWAASLQKQLTDIAKNPLDFGAEKSKDLSVAATSERAEVYFPRQSASFHQGEVAYWILPLAAMVAIGTISFWDKLPWSRSARKVSGGKWVRDRSLGGKLIFIEDEVDKNTKGITQRPLFEDGDLGEEPAQKTASDDAFEAPPNKTLTRTPLIPDWWSPPSTAIYTTAERKATLQKQAKEILSNLQDAKLLKGMDYSVSNLVMLRLTCHEGGGLTVKPATENGRDSMFRAGVKSAIECAQEGSTSLLSGYRPANFVSGLAHDLTVPDSRAITITHAEIAASARALLIQAEAAKRVGDEGEILAVLLRLSAMLREFPLPENSAEAEMVAHSIQKSTSLELRKDIFLVAGSVDASTAANVAELLGFNPDFVMPQLRRYLSSDSK